MKIRDGFVSNSSSSSFIVCFKDGKPKTLGQLQDMMFDATMRGLRLYEGESYPISDVAGAVWDELQGQQPMTAEELLEEASSGSIYGDWYVQYCKIDPPPDSKSAGYYPNLSDEERMLPPQEQQNLPSVVKYYADINAFVEKLEAWNRRMAQAFIDKHPGEYYSFSYSDNDGDFYATMEHAGVFDRLPHISISHH